MKPDEASRKNDTSILPRNGQLIYVSTRRHQITWLAFGWFALIYLGAAIAAFALGKFAGVALGIACLLAAAFSLRIPMTGLVLEECGIKLRASLRTYRWRWNEINRFELKERGHIPRFRVHLRNGRIKKARGFFARGSWEEERSQALFAALVARLKAEQAVDDVDG